MALVKIKLQGLSNLIAKGTDLLLHIYVDP